MIPSNLFKNNPSRPWVALICPSQKVMDIKIFKLGNFVKKQMFCVKRRGDVPELPITKFTNAVKAGL